VISDGFLVGGGIGFVEVAFECSEHILIHFFIIREEKVGIGRSYNTDQRDNQHEKHLEGYDAPGRVNELKFIFITRLRSKWL
jgi:hypothetical protein